MKLNRKNDYIKEYFDRGFVVTPLKGKAPFRSEWPTERLSLEDINQLFSQESYNIGVVLGHSSGGIVDVDLDDDVARGLAPAILPATGMRFGKRSAPGSHYIYRVATPGKPKQFAESRRMVVELRSQGNQTMFPGSVHPETREMIEFEESGEPATVDWAALECRVADVAIATLLVRNWTVGTRHSLALAVAGVLVRNSRDRASIERLVTAVCNQSGDEEREDRIRCVRDTFANLDAGGPLTDISRLIDLIGDDGRQIEKWLVPQLPLPSAAGIYRLETDNDRAEAFAAENRSFRYYCSSEKQWYERRSHVLRPVSNETMLDAVAKAGCSLLIQNKATAPAVQKFFSVSGIRNILTLAQSKLEVDYKQFDLDPSLVGCTNGALSLSDGILVEPDDALITKSIGVPFRPNATCPEFERYLNSVFAGDCDVIEFVQKALGYSLSGSTSEQCLFVLVGSGANGKSTFLNTISELMGEYGSSTPMQTLMSQRYGTQATNDLAALVGKRFVSAAEGEAGAKLAEAKIKRMTGGDPISCRLLYREYFTYVPMFKLWLATNDLPKIEGTTEGIWRRIHVIEFPVTFASDQRDSELPQKLRKELPGILNWVLQGYKKWKQEGRLIPPAKVLNATAAYRHENDTVRLFVGTCCERDGAQRTTTADLFRAYNEWCGKSGFEPLSIAQFGKELGRLGFEGFRSSTGNGWKGIEVRHEAQPF